MRIRNKISGISSLISSLTEKCAAQKLKKTFAVLVYMPHGHVYIIWSQCSAQAAILRQLHT